MPGESEARGLLALLMLQHSRRDARIGRGGELLTIEEQDRRLWRRSEIAPAGRELRAARDRGPYVLQAAIAEVHATAQSPAATRWDRIVALYDELLVATPSPVVELNRAIAVGMRDGPDAGLALLDDVPHYRAALTSAGAPAERAALRRRLAVVTTASRPRAEGV